MSPMTTRYYWGLEFKGVLLVESLRYISLQCTQNYTNIKVNNCTVTKETKRSNLGSCQLLWSGGVKCSVMVKLFIPPLYDFCRLSHT